MKLTNLGVQFLPVTLAAVSPVFYFLGSNALAITCIVLALLTFSMLLQIEKSE